MASFKLRSAALLSIGGLACYSAINIFKYNEKFYNSCVMPLVHMLDPERAHRLGILVSKYQLHPKNPFKDPDVLSVDLFGRKVSNPIGIAAGFDKHAEAVNGLFDLGFGLVEIGSVTPVAQPGNDKPRLFRLKEDLAVVNRYGFNSEGHDAVFERLINLDKSFEGLIGVNLGKNKTSTDAAKDYVQGINKFAPVADYLVVNISSPNTPGLRDLQNEKELNELLKNIIDAKQKIEKDLGMKKPVLLKLAPDLSIPERKDIAKIALKYEIDGLIISNTSTWRPRNMKSQHKDEQGGLSGVPIKDEATKMIADMYKFTNGKITIIGVGGVSSGSDAYEKIRSGASAVQIYTSLVFKGPPVVTKIKSELADLLEQDGYSNIKDVIGVDVPK